MAKLIVALQYLQNALKIAKETRDPFEICRIYNTFGVFRYTTEDYTKAVEYFQEDCKSRKLFRSLSKLDEAYSKRE